MFSPKYFSKLLREHNSFNIEDFCGYCNDYDEDNCNLDDKKKVRACPQIIEAKKNYTFIEHREFYIIKRKLNNDIDKREYCIMDSHKIILIEIGEVYRKSLWDKQFKKEIYYMTLKCSEFKKYFTYLTKSNTKFENEFRRTGTDWGYNRTYIYFALKIIKNPKFMIPINGHAPIIIYNDKITITIAPLVTDNYV